MPLDFDVVAQNLDYLLVGRVADGEPGGLLLTVLMALASGALALVLGVGLAGASWALGGWPRRLIGAGADLIRAVPLIFVIFWLYFLLPALFGETPGPVAVILALAAFSAASVMYTTLAGLEALPPGQTEAALASGLSLFQVLTQVLAPQATRNLAPAYAGLIVSLIKDTSLAFIINVPELTTVAGQVNNQTQVYPAEIFLFVGLVYFVICGGISLAVSLIARRPRRAALVCLQQRMAA